MNGVVAGATGEWIETTLRVLTWNVWGRYGPRPAREVALLRTIETLQPDVIALQECWSDRNGETRPHDSKSPQTIVGNVAVATSSTRATSCRTEVCRVALACGGQSRATEKADRLPRGLMMRAKSAEPPQVSASGALNSRNSRRSIGQRESSPRVRTSACPRRVSRLALA